MPEENKKEKCLYCHDNFWLVKTEIVLGENTPFIFQCPMCNPHGDKAPPIEDRGSIYKLIEFRKGIVKKIGASNEN